MQKSTSPGELSKRDARFVKFWERVHKKGPRAFVLKTSAGLIVCSWLGRYWFLVPLLTFKLMGSEEANIPSEVWGHAGRDLLIKVLCFPIPVLGSWILWRLGERRWRRLMGSA